MPRAFSGGGGPSAAPSSGGSGLADVVREVWDDEDDVAAAAARLGYDQPGLPAETGPLIGDVNELYVEGGRAPPEAWLGALELRHLPGAVRGGRGAGGGASAPAGCAAPCSAPAPASSRPLLP